MPQKRLAPSVSRLFAASMLLLIAASIAGCALPMPMRERAPMQTSLAPSHDEALGRFAAAAGETDGPGTQVQILVEASRAWDARLALIRSARSSIDLQTYYIGRDEVGALVMKELQDAARRGVRVRLLVDDFYTRGRDPWLMALQAEAFGHVRVFNPFFTGRQSVPGRLFTFISDFSRLNHRMHNKLMVVDGVLAIAGGRNLADEYFLRSSEANFIDIEILIAGAVLPSLQAIFDEYWNSELAFGIEQVTQRSIKAPRDGRAQEHLPMREAKDEPVATGPSAAANLVSDQIHERAMASWLPADVGVVADFPDRRPEKTPTHRDSARDRMHQLVDAAQKSYDLVTPYFIPDGRALAQFEKLRARGVSVTVATNGLADTDEPLVNINYNKFRRTLLMQGVRLFEVSATQIERSRSLRQRFGASRGRLHAKLAIIDRETVLLGSVNFDPRSARLNTELGIRVRSPEVARRLINALHMDTLDGVYEVMLDPVTQKLRWLATGDASEVLDDEPGASIFFRLRLLWLSWLVPSDQL